VLADSEHIIGSKNIGSPYGIILWMTTKSNKSTPPLLLPARSLFSLCHFKEKKAHGVSLSFQAGQ
jgi:hypothetical protein